MSGKTANKGKNYRANCGPEVRCKMVFLNIIPIVMISAKTNRITTSMVAQYRTKGLVAKSVMSENLQTLYSLSKY